MSDSLVPEDTNTHEVKTYTEEMYKSSEVYKCLSNWKNCNEAIIINKVKSAVISCLSHLDPNPKKFECIKIVPIPSRDPEYFVFRVYPEFYAIRKKSVIYNVISRRFSLTDYSWKSHVPNHMTIYSGICIKRENDTHDLIALNYCGIYLWVHIHSKTIEKSAHESRSHKHLIFYSSEWFLESIKNMDSNLDDQTGEYKKIKTCDIASRLDGSFSLQIWEDMKDQWYIGTWPEMKEDYYKEFNQNVVFKHEDFYSSESFNLYVEQI